MRKIVLLFCLMLVSNSLHSKDVWIYADYGTWEDGIIALEQFFDYHDISHTRVFADDLNTLDNFEEAKAICFPGGYAYDYKIALSYKTINKLRDYVSSGGSYIGICAGAFFASSSVVWEGIEYFYPLRLFEGKAIGSIYEIAPWANYKMTNISINKDNHISQNTPDDLTVLYYGGPYFESDVTKFDTIATWDDFHDYPAIINFDYEQGKVLLIGPHLEIEEDDSRDSTEFANELNDIESDWDFLSTMVNWVLQTNTGVETNNGLNQRKIISPNPASEYIEISGIFNHWVNPMVDGEDEKAAIKIYNSFGIEVGQSSLIDIQNSNIINVSQAGMPKLLRIDISDLPVGLYFIQFGNYTEKFMVVR